VVFDEHAIFGERARRWYPLVRSYMAHQDPADDAVLPKEPTFSSDQEALPLQAADMLAWILRRSFEPNWESVERWEVSGKFEGDRTHPGDFSWLAFELRRVPASSQVQFLTRRRLNGIMQKIGNRLEPGIDTATLPSGYVDAYHELWRESRGGSKRSRRDA
jgi:hypothetical protein